MERVFQAAAKQATAGNDNSKMAAMLQMLEVQEAAAPPLQTTAKAHTAPPLQPTAKAHTAPPLQPTAKAPPAKAMPSKPAPEAASSEADAEMKSVCSASSSDSGLVAPEMLEGAAEDTQSVISSSAGEVSPGESDEDEQMAAALAAAQDEEEDMLVASDPYMDDGEAISHAELSELVQSGHHRTAMRRARGGWRVQKKKLRQAFGALNDETPSSTALNSQASSSTSYSASNTARLQELGFNPVLPMPVRPPAAPAAIQQQHDQQRRQKAQEQARERNLIAYSCVSKRPLCIKKTRSYICSCRLSCTSMNMRDLCLCACCVRLCCM